MDNLSSNDMSLRTHTAVSGGKIYDCYGMVNKCTYIQFVSFMCKTMILHQNGTELCIAYMHGLLKHVSQGNLKTFMNFVVIYMALY